MFTGIIEAIGTIRGYSPRADGARAVIGAGPLAEGLRVGDSIAVDGACLTVTSLKGGGFACDLSAETLARTTLRTLRVGARVNLERPLRLGDRLGGHLVTGHVDAVGQVADRVPQGDGEFVRFRFPPDLAPLLVMKGSIAVDGISLTVAELGRDTFGVALIPHTLHHTTLGGKRVGDPVNLEADLLGKHVARLLAGRADFVGQEGLTLASLKEHGFA
ncbi:MAG: riboflavin synthase [candidate division NC10 bacterium]|nr:riboflavin synthase [candidate division NC10 bacterium]